MMAEPSSSAIGSIAITTGVITLTGSVFGLEYDAMLMGLLGGLIALMHLPSPKSGSIASDAVRTAMSLISAAILGALFSPIAGPALNAWMEFTQKIPPTALRLAAAGAIGLTAQVIVPLVFALLKRKSETV